MDAYLGHTEAAPVPDDDKFPHPSTSTSKRKCKECVSDASGDGYKKKKDSLGSLKSQCQKCSNSCCKEHSILLCKGCAEKVVFREPEAPPPRREVT